MSRQPERRWGYSLEGRVFALDECPGPDFPLPRWCHAITDPRPMVYDLDALESGPKDNRTIRRKAWREERAR